MKTIDGQILKTMLMSGANNLYNHYPEVDALNVFPVPDGDTGMNMNLTMTSGAKEIENRDDSNVYTIAKVFSRGLLMGARGNSGVITSQIFRGFAEGLKDKKIIDAISLADAFESGREVAYRAVIKPVEGTILTVIRESSTVLVTKARKNMSIEECFKILLEEAKASLQRTPNLLPILKEVGVVDSGGAGLVTILEGMNSALNGKFIERNEISNYSHNGSAQVAANEDEEEFGYCTEFILQLGPAETKKPFNKERFTARLATMGNSLVVVQDDDLVKVHVHTLRPGNVFNFAQNYGEFKKLKSENMTEQHNEILFKEAHGELKNHMAAADLKDAPLKAPKIKEKKEKEFALVATSSGKGIDQTFNEVGCEYIVSGGQTMNPSTNDFVTAIEETSAKHVFVFPNNSNIILAANQAKDILDGKVDVIVVPTKTIMQGIACAMNFNEEISISDNIDAMNEAINSIKSGCVTFAIKDSEVNGINVKKDEFMAIKESKDIISSQKNKLEALKVLLNELIDEDSAVLTIFYGEDVNDKEKEEVKNYLEKTYSDIDLDLRDGNQPVYSFLVGIE